jgi:hypothetical protein
MNRLFIILLSLQIATGNILGCELSKLPFILQHYNEHQTQNTDISFWDFLNLHYFDTNHKNSDPCHNDLPLQHSHTITILDKTFTQICFIFGKIEPIIVAEKPIFQQEESHSVDYVKRLFRPPSHLLSFLC